jgi:hypothetical protein
MYVHIFADEFQDGATFLMTAEAMYYKGLRVVFQSAYAID